VIMGKKSKKIVLPSLTESIMACTLAAVIVKCIQYTEVVNRLLDPNDPLQSPKDLVDVINIVDKHRATLEDRAEALGEPLDPNIFIYSLNLFHQVFGQGFRGVISQISTYKPTAEFGDLKPTRRNFENLLGFDTLLSSLKETLPSVTVKIVFDWLLTQKGFKTNPRHISIDTIINSTAVMSYLLKPATDEEEEEEEGEEKEVIERLDDFQSPDAKRRRDERDNIPSGTEPEILSESHMKKVDRAIDIQSIWGKSSNFVYL
jgi:hypothetical protein